MEKKSRLGANPLAHYLSSQDKSVVDEASLKPAQVDLKSDNTANTLVKKERITIHVPMELIDKVKNIVYWEPGVTLTSFAQRAFELAVQEKEAERGQPYPERKERLLKSGRPVG